MATHKKEWITCDICDVEIPSLGTSENVSERIERVEYTVYYGGTTSLKHVCVKCSNKILAVISDLKQKKTT